MIAYLKQFRRCHSFFWIYGISSRFRTIVAEIQVMLRGSFEERRDFSFRSEAGTITRRREIRCRVIKLTTRRVSSSNLHARISSHLVTESSPRNDGEKTVNLYFLLFSRVEIASFRTKILKFLFNRWIKNVFTRI